MDIVGFLKVLLKRKWLILGISILASVATFLIAIRTSKVYLAKAQIATGITEATVPTDSEVLTNPMEAVGKFSNLIEVITSKQVLSLLSYKLALHDLKEPVPFKSIEDLKKTYSPTDLAQAQKVIQNKLDSIQILHNTDEKERIYVDMIKDMGYDVKSLEKTLEIYRIDNTDYIEIKYKSRNPYLSAFTVNTLCQEIIRYYNNMTNKRLENSVKFFSDLAAQKKADLDGKLDSLNKYKTNKQVINFDDERKSKMSQISTLESNRDEENKKINALRQTIVALKSRLSEGDDENYDNQYANNKILNLKNRLNALQERYITSGNRDKRAADSINIIKNELESQIARFGNNLDVKPNTSKQELNSKKLNAELELETAKSNLQAIEGTLYGLKSNLSGFASNESSISAMEMAISVAKDEYLHVLDKFNSAKNFSLSSGNIHQIEYGEPADEPEPSKVMIFTVLAGVVSFVFCVVTLFILEYLDSTIKRPSHFFNLANLPILGVVNQLKSSKIDFEGLFNQTHKNTILETHKQLLRKLRYEVETSNAKIFLFTSTKASEGKTFSIVSLAYSLALSSKKILIVDSNLKSNGLTKLFSAQPGLNAFLVPRFAKNVPAKEAIINKTQVPNIDIIGCEQNNYSPMEILDREKLETFLREASEKYDYVFMEGAALNTFSDTKELIFLSDKVVAVFSAKSQIKKSDNSSIGFLASLNEKFAGSVLNKVDLENLDQ